MNVARAPLRSFDRVGVAYALAVAALLALYGGREGSLWSHAGAHLLLALGVAVVARNRRRWPAWCGDWYPVLLVPLAFRMNGAVVPQVNPADWDARLLALDVQLFGAHPAHYLRWIEGPLTTEILRLCWMSYFVLPLLVMLALYRRGEGLRSRYERALAALLAGWLVSYLAYFATPALGPGYRPDLVGEPPATAGSATQGALSMLFSLEGEGARDVCPSGHTIIALLVLWIAFRERLAWRWLLVPLIAGLLLGTIYLRYHYGVDLLYGALLALGCAAWAERAARPPAEEVASFPSG